jgi:hypothetical protein
VTAERKMMRICYVADGTSIHTQRWLNYAVAMGHEVHLICWRISPGYDTRIEEICAGGLANKPVLQLRPVVQPDEGIAARNHARCR